MHRNAKEGEPRKLSPALRRAYKVFGMVISEPESTEEETEETIEDRSDTLVVCEQEPNLFRLITEAKAKELGLVTPCDGCINGCIGGEIEVFKKEAVACRPTNKVGLFQLRHAFNIAVDPSSLYCRQPQGDEVAVKFEIGGHEKTVSRSQEKQSV